MASSDAAPLFPPHLIPTPSPADPSFVWRPLRIDDYDKGFCGLLGQLTEVGGLTKEGFEARWREMAQANSTLGPTYHVVVCEDVSNKKLVASGTIFIERKFTRTAGLCGHIEDIVVDKSVRGKNLGLKLIKILTSIGAHMKCYKVILDCEEKNVAFYEKCGFTKKDVMMALYFAQKSKL